MAEWYSMMWKYHDIFTKPSELDIQDSCPFKALQAGRLEIQQLSLMLCSCVFLPCWNPGPPKSELVGAGHSQAHPASGWEEQWETCRHPGLTSPWGTGSREGSRSWDITQGLCLCWPPQLLGLCLGPCREACSIRITQGTSIVSELDRTPGHLNQNLWELAQDIWSLFQVSLLYTKTTAQKPEDKNHMANLRALTFSLFQCYERDRTIPQHTTCNAFTQHACKVPTWSGSYSFLAKFLFGHRFDSSSKLFMQIGKKLLAGNLVTCIKSHKTVQNPWPTYSTFGIHAKDITNRRKSYMHKMFIAALFILMENWRHLNVRWHRYR